MRTRVLLFAAAAVIATLAGALAGALTLPRSEAGSVDTDLPPPSSDPRPSPPPAPTFEVSGPCDEPEHASDPECATIVDGDDDDDDDHDDDDSSGPGGGGNSGPG